MLRDATDNAVSILNSRTIYLIQKLYYQNINIVLVDHLDKFDCFCFTIFFVNFLKLRLFERFSALSAVKMSY